MNLRFFDWIWHIKGSLPLAHGQSSDEVFERLDPLFRQTGTTHERTNGTLSFRKKDPAAQDKMSVFDRGVLKVENDGTGGVLNYYLSSRALLFCFLAPLLFLSFGQLTVALGTLNKPSAEAEKTAEDKKKDAKKEAERPMNPIDKALGAPAPEKPDKNKKDKKPSPTPAYVFAGIFATLYVVGRFLEQRLVKSLFKKRLLGETPVALSEPA
ncbi:hypothetical protein [Novosphingobium album (ex Hu et al. 2023)]|uniref:Uncharacterized protein n=1 Tax=Novosphingobium album (ex Hu et al. 2023) TaxID=2930093 RepID=A0ABT0B3R7_9SPHN|nr:hypothetical protein [Novosphingobium album (ex Hu et al. 2023)]MCJ2179697.1 hypothetical protein [Novosphingobium album (ex Hu et al. 2023)]